MPHLTPDPDAPEATETGVIIRVSEAEALVGEHRQRLTWLPAGACPLT